jgi:hypothetical protein
MHKERNRETLLDLSKEGGLEVNRGQTQEDNMFMACEQMQDEKIIYR